MHQTTSTHRSNEDDQSLPPTSAELDRWKSLIRSSPPLRPEKLRSSRDAIQRNTYDEESVIDATADKVWSELDETGWEDAPPHSGRSQG